MTLRLTRRRQRLRRQGPVGRSHHHPAVARGDVRQRGEHHRRQRHWLRRDERRDLHQRRRRRTLRGAQLRRDDHRRGHRGPRVRVHDRGRRRDPRRRRAKPRRGHVGRHALPLRPRARASMTTSAPASTRSIHWSSRTTSGCSSYWRASCDETGSRQRRVDAERMAQRAHGLRAHRDVGVPAHARRDAQWVSPPGSWSTRARARVSTGPRATTRLARGIRTPGRRRGRRPGRSLHGLRHTVLHAGLSTGQPDPDFNDHVYRSHWEQAAIQLFGTNNFPEFTGRLCPAPCESACVLGISDSPVTIERIEYEVAEHAFANGFDVARVSEVRTGHRVAVVGSGPAGLAAAAQLRERRSRRPRLRTRRRHRRTAALRHTGVQTGKGDPRSAPRRDGILRGHVSLGRHDRRRRARRSPTCSATSTPCCSRSGRRDRDSSPSREPSSRASIRP